MEFIYERNILIGNLNTLVAIVRLGCAISSDKPSKSSEFVFPNVLLFL